MLWKIHVSGSGWRIEVGTDLESQDLGLDERQGLAIDLDEARASLTNRIFVSKPIRFDSDYALNFFSPSILTSLMVSSCCEGRTLQWATAVAVFFLPKVWTLWDAMMA